MPALSSRARLTLLLALSSVSRVAHGQTTVQACSDAYTKGQEERLDGRLFDARAQFRICGDSTCPGAIVSDCNRWIAEVEAQLPTIAVKASGPDGRAIDGFSFSVDGAAIPNDQLARPVVVDVGPHVFRFEARGFQATQLEHEVALEDRELAIGAVMQPVLAPAPPPPPPAPAPAPAPSVDTDAPQPPLVATPPDTPFPVAAVTLASVGAVALGGAVYFGLSAEHEYHELQGSCGHTCTNTQRESVDNKALLSDIALGVSAVAVGAAAWVYFSNETPTQGSAALGLEPRADGARLRVRLTF